MAKIKQYDDVWAANFKRMRRTLKGTRLTVDPVTGYLEPVGRDGFTADDRATFIERLKVCSNITQICKSIPIDKMTFFDALVVDAKFRKDVNEALLIEGRATQLNDSLANIRYEEKKTVIEDLGKKIGFYK
jgi:hypothetical protein